MSFKLKIPNIFSNFIKTIIGFKACFIGSPSVLLLSIVSVTGALNGLVYCYANLRYNVNLHFNLSDVSMIGSFGYLTLFNPSKLVQNPIAYMESHKILMYTIEHLHNGNNWKALGQYILALTKESDILFCHIVQTTSTKVPSFILNYAQDHMSYYRETVYGGFIDTVYKLDFMACKEPNFNKYQKFVLDLATSNGQGYQVLTNVQNGSMLLKPELIDYFTSSTSTKPMSFVVLDYQKDLRVEPVLQFRFNINLPNLHSLHNLPNIHNLPGLSNLSMLINKKLQFI